MGYSYASIDELGDGAFRKVRRALGITAFGANVVVIPPDATSNRMRSPPTRKPVRY